MIAAANEHLETEAKADVVAIKSALQQYKASGYLGFFGVFVSLFFAFLMFMASDRMRLGVVDSKAVAEIFEYICYLNLIVAVAGGLGSVFTLIVARRAEAAWARVLAGVSSSKPS
jgi:predicted component of viral defense system (DUF524 family)